MEKKKIKKVVIKVGSSLIANYKTGLPKLNWINSFINDLCFLIKKKINIIIVSSGAIAIGRKKIGFLKKKLNLDEQQAAASVGQIYLINNYKKAFNKKKIDFTIIKNAILAAGSAPNGANLQPWHFSIIKDKIIKRKIRLAAEKEEGEFYKHKAPVDWLKALEPLGPDSKKKFYLKKFILLNL